MPIALFFHVKHSSITVAGNKISLDSLLEWYQRCKTALAAVSKKFRVGIVLVTNREVTLPGVADWPENLLVISRDQLGTYLGPLAHRGLLANPQ